MLRIYIIFTLSISCLFANPPKDIKEQLLTPRQLQVYKEKQQLLAESQTKKLTIFYLTSHSMGNEAASTFSNSIQKLKEREVDVQGLIVLRGFPNDFKNYVHKIFEKAKNTEAILKIHPFIFRAFDIKRVPAYVIADCHTGNNFSFKQCDIHYIIHGDIALSDVFRRLGDVDKTYIPYYFKMIEAK